MIVGTIAVGGLAAIGAWWLREPSPSATELGWRAASDSTAPWVATERGERRDTLVAPGIRVTMAPLSRIRLPVAASEGRGLAVDGDVRLTVASDSASPIVVRAGRHRVEGIGGTFAFSVRGDTTDVLVTTGDLQHVASTVTTRIGTGRAVRITPDGLVMTPPAAERTARFAWHDGRWRVGPAPLRGLREALLRWYGLELATDLTDTIAVDVPLDSVDALLAALGADGRRAVTVGRRIEVSRPVATRGARAARTPAPIAVPEPPALRRLPGIP